MKKSTLCFCLAVATCSLLVSGCATTGSTTNIEKSEKITTSVLDTQDFAKKGEEMVASLLESGVLDKVPKPPAVIGIGRIVNNTTLYIDRDELMKKIRVALNKGNKAVTDTTGGVLNTLDFTFSGKIIENKTKDGNKTQRTYTFQLSLTDSQGLAVWEEEKEVNKLTKRSGLGL